jgi:transcriptional regulator with XRE-family HTH domain
MGDTRGLAGDLISQARHASGLSQAELARRAGMHRSVLNAYERHHRQPGVDALARIARAAGLELALERSTGPIDPHRAGRILVQVLDLAETLPARRRGSLRYPSLRTLVP